LARDFRSAFSELRRSFWAPKSFGLLDFLKKILASKSLKIRRAHRRRQPVAHVEEYKLPKSDRRRMTAPAA
jgi:hypothetical protein